MIYAFMCVLGLLFGSFLNVCIYRIPRVHFRLTEEVLARLREQIPQEILARLESLKDQDYCTEDEFFEALRATIGEEALARYEAPLFKQAFLRRESIVFPGSHCPVCHAPIRAWENIPLFSFLLLRGRCRACGTKISWRYPLVELLTGVLFVGITVRFGLTLQTPVYLLFVCALIAITFIDFDHQIIPDVISIPGLVVGLAASFFLPIGWQQAGLGALVGGGIIIAIVYIGPLIFKQEAMGWGDVKLMAMIGAFVGWEMALLTLFLASISGALVGVAAAALQKTSLKSYIPFGPFLCFGAFVSLVWGPQLFAWYWQLVTPPM